MVCYIMVMKFDNQLDENTVTEILHANERIEVQETTDGQFTDDAVKSSPDFSNLTTVVGDNPYIRRRPLPLKVLLYPRNHRLPLLDITCEKLQTNLRPNPKPTANPDFRGLDALISIHWKKR